MDIKSPIRSIISEYKPVIGKITNDSSKTRKSYKLPVHYKSETYIVTYTPATEESDDVAKGKIKGIAKAKIKEIVKLYNKLNDNDISSISYTANKDTVVNTREKSLSQSSLSQSLGEYAKKLEAKKTVKENVIKTSENTEISKENVNNLNKSAKKEIKKRKKN